MSLSLTAWAHENPGGGQRGDSGAESSLGPNPAIRSMTEVPNLEASRAYRYRLQITIAALAFGWTASLFTLPILKEHSHLDHLLDAVAWILLLAGMGLRAWASHEISGKKKVVIVTTGAYAFCRNPLYWGTFLIACSQLAFLRTISFALAMMLPVLVYLFGVIPAEERYLAAVLGDEYRLYCDQTARWIPHWRSAASQDTHPVLSPAYYRELATLACWFVLPVVAELICYLRELPNWPHWSLLR